MKKILLTSMFFTALALGFTGCLKDKGFEDHEYGINDPDDSPAGIGFPFASKAKNSVGVEVSTSPQVISDVPVLVIFAGEPAASDINIKLTVNSGLVTAYNAANGTTILPLSTSLFSLSTLNVVLKAGQRTVAVPITVSNTTTLDPQKSYGIGVTISSVDPGYTIAKNYSNLLIELNIKNKYDGKYSEKGFFNHPLYANPFSINVQLWTTGTNSVVLYYPPFAEFSRPFNVGGGSINRFADIAPVFTIDPVTNKVTVVNYFPAGSALSMDPAYNSRYEPATKTIYAKYGYNAARTRDWTDTLTYTGPR